jgi:D-proline dehydrogenase
MAVAIVGGGITGLFVAYYLEKEGETPVLFEPGPPGVRSAHAAGIIEPSTAYRTNTIAFLRRAFRLWRNGVCRFRRVDARWLVESARVLERRPMETMDETLIRMGRESLRVYEGLSEETDDFGYRKGGLLETFDDPVVYAEERQAAEARTRVTPFEVREHAGHAGGLYYPEVAWVDTDRFIVRILRELRRTSTVRQRVQRVALDGTISTAERSEQFETVVIASGVAARTLGLPLTGVRGYGWHLTTREPPEVATISVDRGIALVPLAGSVKATGGWDFDLGTTWSGAASVLEGIRGMVPVESILDFNEGSRPCTPDGLPTVGRRERTVTANGGFRLGWSFAPAMGRAAAELAVGKSSNDPFLSRFCGSIRSGSLG